MLIRKTMNQLLRQSLVNQLCVKCVQHMTSRPIGLSAIMTANAMNLRPNNKKYLLNGNQLVLNERSGGRHVRHVFTTNTCYTNVENYTPFDTMDGLIYKVRRYFGYSSVPKYRLRNTSVYLYESATDGVDIEKFFVHLNLPDTYLSWFLVTELHVWMLMIRSMVEGKEGRLMRNEITARMWEDCETRLKLMTHMPQSVRRKGLEDLLQQFRASLIAYDEGFLTDDKTLAAALWRTLFTYESVDPKYLELIVQYIRTQVEHLHTIGTEKFFLDGKITWKPFPPFYP